MLMSGRTRIPVELPALVRNCHDAVFGLKLVQFGMNTYRFTFPDEARARAFVHDLTQECSRLCIYRTGSSVTVLDGSDAGQRERIYSNAWARGATGAGP